MEKVDKKPKKQDGLFKRIGDLLPTVAVASIWGFSLRNSVRIALDKDPKESLEPKKSIKDMKPSSEIRINKPKNPGKFILKLAELGKFKGITRERLEQIGITNDSTVEDFDLVLTKTPFTEDELEGIKILEEFILPQLKQGIPEKIINKTIKNTDNYKPNWIDRTGNAVFGPIVGFAIAKQFGLSTRESLKVAFGKNEPPEEKR